MNRVTTTSYQLWRAFTRKKNLDVQQMQETQLKKCLTVLDLIALGVGSSLGAGVYVLVGTVTRTLTGPAILVSFFIAAFASFLSGMCYAEFAARVPKAGSAYVYSYVSVGEFWAYVIGWNMILENIIGVAASGKAWSQFVDAMFNDTIRRTLEDKIRLSSDEDGWLDSYPDILAVCFLILVSLFSCVGVKLSSRINLLFTLVNLSMIACIVSVGFSKAQLVNWTQSPHGFFPFGFRGVMAGAATCFYSFIGFDTIATSGEESINPTRHVPIAIVATLVICLVCFLGVGSVLTLLVPWNTLAHTATLPKAFAQREVYGADYAIAIGGVCGLTASTLTSIYPLPRSIYSMAQDGLLFRWLGVIYKRTEVPVSAAVISGILVALAALLLDLDSLIEMMSIGTLMAYTMVAISVLVLHYQKESVGFTALNQPSHTSSLQPSSLDDAKEASVKRTKSTNKDTLNPINSTNIQQRHSISASLFSPNNNASLPHSTRLFSTVDTSRIALSEDTGLLKVGGDGGNKVRYVPTKTTTVIKKIKPRQEAEDSDNEEEEGVVKPAITLNSPKDHPFVEEYRTKLKLQQEQEKQLQLTAEQTQKNKPNHQTTNPSTSQPSQLFSFKRHKGSYQPMDTSQSSLHPLPSADPTPESRKRVIVSTILLVTAWVFFCILSVHGPGIFHPLSGSTLSELQPENMTSESFRQPGKLYQTMQSEKSVGGYEDGKGETSNGQNKNGGDNNINNNNNLPSQQQSHQQHQQNLLQSIHWHICVIYTILLSAVVVLGAIIGLQPQNHTALIFTTPLIPLLPILSILTNIYLMFTLSDITWIRFIVWLAIGFVIYFAYGIWNSSERRADDQEIIMQYGPEQQE